MIFYRSKLPRLVSWFFPVSAITIGPFIFVRAGVASSRLLRHERIHVAQGQELLFVGFWALYLFFWVLNLLKYGNPRHAYLMIPFELEARAHERTKDYLKTRPLFHWRHFTS